MLRHERFQVNSLNVKGRRVFLKGEMRCETFEEQEKKAVENFSFFAFSKIMQFAYFFQSFPFAHVIPFILIKFDSLRYLWNIIERLKFDIQITS